VGQCVGRGARGGCPAQAGGSWVCVRGWMLSRVLGANAWPCCITLLLGDVGRRPACTPPLFFLTLPCLAACPVQPSRGRSSCCPDDRGRERLAPERAHEPAAPRRLRARDQDQRRLLGLAHRHQHEPHVPGEPHGGRGPGHAAAAKAGAGGCGAAAGASTAAGGIVASLLAAATAAAATEPSGPGTAVSWQSG